MNDGGSAVGDCFGFLGDFVTLRQLRRSEIRLGPVGAKFHPSAISLIFRQILQLFIQTVNRLLGVSLVGQQCLRFWMNEAHWTTQVKCSQFTHIQSTNFRYSVTDVLC